MPRERECDVGIMPAAGSYSNPGIVLWPGSGTGVRGL